MIPSIAILHLFQSTTGNKNLKLFKKFHYIKYMHYYLIYLNTAVSSHVLTLSDILKDPKVSNTVK